MNRTSLALLVGLLAGASVGCSPKDTPAPDKAPNSPAPAPASTSNAPESSPPSKPATEAAPAVTVSMRDLPPDLRNDAFDYYGLENEKPLRFKAKLSNPSASSIQTNQVKLISIKDGKAVFELSQKGGPNGDTVQTMSLEPDGLYDIALSPQVLKSPHVIEFPAKLPDGSSWPSNQAIEQEGRDVTLDSTFKVVGHKTISTELGKYDAIEVTSTGKGSAGSQPVTITSHSWYAKGIGAVKQEITMKAGGKSTVYTLEITK